MKKFLFLGIIILSLFNISYGVSTDIINPAAVIESQNRISKIGFNLLNSNGIEHRMVFYFDVSKSRNAYTTYRDNQIVLYRGLYNILSSDDEIAAVLAHEISHGADYRQGALKGYFTPFAHTFAPKKYEYKADKRGVDYMVNAGYNPVAMIVAFSKFMSQERFDWHLTHPLPSKRMMEVYEYIYKKYPEYLANNKYKDNIYYQNFLLTSKTNRSKFQNKIKTNSKKAIKYE